MHPSRAATMGADPAARQNSQRVRRVLQRAAAAAARATPAEPLRWLVIRERRRVIFLKPDDIDWIRAAGNYVRVHALENQHLMRMTLSGLEERLAGLRFVRIHRSTIINLERVRELRPQEHGDYLVVLQGGAIFRLSRRYYKRFLRLERS